MSCRSDQFHHTPHEIFAQTLIHPTVFTSEGTNMPGSFFITFLVALGGMLALAASMISVELRGKTTALRIRDLRRQLAGTDA